MQASTNNFFQNYFNELAHIFFCTDSRESDTSCLTKVFLAISSPLGVPIMGLFWGASSLIGRVFQGTEAGQPERKTERIRSSVFSQPKGPSDSSQSSSSPSPSPSSSIHSVTPPPRSLSALLSPSPSPSSSFSLSSSSSSSSAPSSSSSPPLTLPPRSLSPLLSSSSSSSSAPSSSSSLPSSFNHRLEPISSIETSSTPEPDYICPLRKEGPNKEQLNFLIEKMTQFCDEQKINGTNERYRDLFQKLFTKAIFVNDPKAYMKKNIKDIHALNSSCSYGPVEAHRDQFHNRLIEFFERFCPSEGSDTLTPDQEAFRSARLKDKPKPTHSLSLPSNASKKQQRLNQSPASSSSSSSFSSSSALPVFSETTQRKSSMIGSSFLREGYILPGIPDCPLILPRGFTLSNRERLPYEFETNSSHHNKLVALSIEKATEFCWTVTRNVNDQAKLVKFFAKYFNQREFLNNPATYIDHLCRYFFQLKDQPPYPQIVNRFLSELVSSLKAEPTEETF